MHQPIVTLDPVDLDDSNPVTEKPFFKWLESNPEQYFVTALTRYLGVPKGAYRGWMETEQLTVFRHTYHHFWFLRLRKYS